MKDEDHEMVGLLTAMAAVAALSAMPARASASTSNWKMGGTELSSAATIPASRNFGWSGSIGASGCPVTATLDPGAHSSAGNVTAFAVPNLGSRVNSGALAGCTLTSVSVEHIPWAFSDESNLVACRCKR